MKIVKRIIACGLAGLMIFGIYTVSLRATRVEYAHLKYEQFFKDKTDYDVMFFGASHTQNGLYPMQLWKDYGITSYNMGGPDSSLPTSYYMLKLALKYHKPKVAVLDVIMADKNDISWDYSVAHHYLDAFPLSEKKIEAVDFLFPDTKKKLEMLFPYYVYHGGWKDIDKEAIEGVFKENHWPTFGAEYESLIQTPPEPLQFVSQDAGYDGGETTGHQYIRKFVELCRENDIEPMLMFFPCGCEESAQRAANEVYRIAGEMEVPYVNLIYEEGLINQTIDYTDGGGHLNPSGARKVTEWMGSFLTSNFQLQDHRDDDNYSELWNTTYSSYLEFIENYLQESTDLMTALMNMYNDEYYSYIEVNPGFEADEAEQMLIDQLLNENLAEIKEADTPGENRIKIRVTEVESGKEICTLAF